MASNSFGNIFKITTWGESHGKAIGVVIDGCPAGLEISENDINNELALRSPGNSLYTSPRQEKDSCEILSGVFEGRTTGAPISIVIRNKDFDGSKYDPIKDLLRPGHANYTFLEKYGIFDHRGGGRASARETACRVAAGTIAKCFIQKEGITVVAYLTQVCEVVAKVNPSPQLRDEVYRNKIYCPDEIASGKMMTHILDAKEKGDSVGGVVELRIENLPTGLGDPVYEKLEANLAKAMMTIPASKGFEIGSGFQSVLMRGSEHNDRFEKIEERIQTATNHAGGTLGGISTGMPLLARVVFKPTSSIKMAMSSLNIHGESAEFKLPEGSRHDPCVAIRAVPVVEAMGALVIADALLMNRCAKMDSYAIECS